jgi:hypothetical protein
LDIIKYVVKSVVDLDIYYKKASMRAWERARKESHSIGKGKQLSFGRKKRRCVVAWTSGGDGFLLKVSLCNGKCDGKLRL